jgi:hypothetical protein
MKITIHTCIKNILVIYIYIYIYTTNIVVYNLLQALKGSVTPRWCVCVCVCTVGGIFSLGVRGGIFPFFVCV